MTDGIENELIGANNPVDAKSGLEERHRSTYQYMPLKDKHDIRLVKLSPLLLNDESGAEPEIAVEIFHTNLDASPLYTAISYMWGSSDDVVEVDIGGSVLSVRNSLRRMLLDLCDKRLSRLLFIDALCINQQDNLERSAQVGLMGLIYSKANYVIAYLTSSAGGSGLWEAANHIHALAQGHERSKSKKAPDCQQLFNNAYFTRRWIIQEICLARSVILRCDGYDLPIGMLHRQFWSNPDDGECLAARLCVLRKRTENPSSTLEELLYNHSQAVCSITLDKVYALLALTSKAKSFLRVDYNLRSLELMISILEMSTHHEALPAERLMGFACFLQKDLSLTREEIRSSAAMSYKTDQARKFLIKGICRGYVRGSRIDANSENIIEGVCHRLPSLLQYSPVSLENVPTGKESHGSDEIQTFRIRHETSVGIDEDPGQETNALALWRFSYENSDTEHKETYDRNGSVGFRKTKNVRCGMSTVVMEVGDELWQFARAPVAVVVRVRGQQRSIIGRALLLNTTAGCFRPAPTTESRIVSNGKSGITLGNCSSDLLEVLDWLKPQSGNEDMSLVKHGVHLLPDQEQDPTNGRTEDAQMYDPKKELQIQRSILASLPDLLQLMTWVNMDNNGDGLYDSKQISHPATETAVESDAESDPWKNWGLKQKKTTTTKKKKGKTRGSPEPDTREKSLYGW